MLCAAFCTKPVSQVKNCAIAYNYLNQVLTNRNRHRIIRDVPGKEHTER